MPAITIDDDVQIALAEKAIEAKLDLFSPDTPNLVLRSLLGLSEQRAGGPIPDDPDGGLGPFSASTILKARSVAEAALTTVPAGTVTAAAVALSRLRIGSRLLREHVLACTKGYFSKTGIPYQKPNGFPAAFFDKYGYRVFDNEESMLITPGVNIGKQVSIPRVSNRFQVTSSANTLTADRKIPSNLLS